MRGLAKGKAQKELVYELGISPDTMKTYLQRARKQLGATNTLHAVVIAATSGQLEQVK